MNSLFDTYVAPLKQEEHNEYLADKLYAYLKEHGSIHRRRLMIEGLPGTGPFGNPGQPIHMLRERGIKIETIDRGAQCIYKLVETV